MAPLKIIGAGYGRTGTDSLRSALDILGYRTHHMRSMYQDEDSHPELFLEAFNHPERPVDWDYLYNDYDAAVDWPTATFVKRLVESYPEAKVLLTVRDPDSWYKSMRNTVFRSLTTPITSEKGLKSRAMSKVICMDGLLSTIQPNQPMDEIMIKAKYNAHNEWVIQAVPPERLLVLKLGEGWDRLCRFLDKPIPDIPYPHSNSTEEFIRCCEEGGHPYLK
ncbi:P-loop containing nucleoside triphosphate hydrolase protein [Fennellomyces sp. T-0311]|nr:P-loop containing nucleoside triphosphate hydrolase protein [Fennellomyces sp. T-0311]